jgi:hypothetical protein
MMRGQWLARISHQLSTAAAYLPAPTALRLENVLNVLSSTPARIFRRAPCIHGQLRAFATTPGEKCEPAACQRRSILSSSPMLVRTFPASYR